ncbi:hypothetical protein EJ04DRAFT_96031 [Polyplosphaeria fusca]|uniref:Uncharacterized protein n=1 Tax=Polyplosphaeria fusca TaxID=682080 RepID=A0A9P4R7A1_9PLEO|nr:hypothetical protein EJ04DRAFT_96031 [Polyplosphaeria fusca]
MKSWNLCRRCSRPSYDRRTRLPDAGTRTDRQAATIENPRLLAFCSRPSALGDQMRVGTAGGEWDSWDPSGLYDSLSTPLPTSLLHSRHVKACRLIGARVRRSGEFPEDPQCRRERGPGTVLVALQHVSDDRSVAQASLEAADGMRRLCFEPAALRPYRFRSLKRFERGLWSWPISLGVQKGGSLVPRIRKPQDCVNFEARDAASLHYMVI